MATLNLPDDRRTVIWRLTREQLRTDASLSTLLLIFFDTDDENGVRSIGDFQVPTVRFYPTCGPASQWFDEGSLNVALTVYWEAFLPDSDAEDVLNLQGAIEACLSPDDSRVFYQTIVDAGGVTGYPRFDNAATQPLQAAGGGHSFMPKGSFSFQIIRTMNF